MKNILFGFACAGLLLSAAGCKKSVDSTPEYKAALDRYYASKPVCVFDKPTRLPAQEKTSDKSETAPFDALFNQGLLTRSTDEKKKFLIFSEQVTNYDLSPAGRKDWTVDSTQPGYGNFCYGTLTVSGIDSATANSGKPGASSTVNYHAGVSNLPSWAAAATTQDAFPQMRNAIQSTSYTAVLTNTIHGWAVTRSPSTN